jgi:YD repeat-containing protein
MRANLRCKWQSRRRRALLTTAAIVLVCLGIFPGLAADISYVYDDAGRLRAVIDPASDTAVYAYDAVGNLTGITRQPSSTLAVLQFTPSSSPVGTTATVLTASTRVRHALRLQQRRADKLGHRRLRPAGGTADDV